MPSPTTDNPASSTTTTSSAAADSTSTTTGTTPASLETDLLTHLASTTALDDIHTNLLCYLQRMGWTEKIRTLSLELLRAGRCERFDEVVDAVIASAECRPHPAFDLSAASANGTNHAKGSKNGTGTSGSNGTTGKNGTAANGTMGLSADAEAYLENVDVRIPSVVVEHGVRMVKDVLKDVVSWEDGTSFHEGLLEQSTTGASGGSGPGSGGAGAGAGAGQAAGSKTGGSGASGNHTSVKKLDKDKDKDKDDAGDSSTSAPTSKKNGDSSSPVKKTAKKSHPGKTGK